jgi:WD40 repeat protein
MLVSGTDDNVLKLWDTQAQTCVATLTGHTDDVTSVAVLKDMRDPMWEDKQRNGKDIVVSGSKDNTVRLWNVWAEKVGAGMGANSGGGGNANTAVVVLNDLRDNGVVACGNDSGGVTAWDLSTGFGKLVLEDGGHEMKADEQDEHDNHHVVCASAVDGCLMIVGGAGTVNVDRVAKAELEFKVEEETLWEVYKTDIKEKNAHEEERREERNKTKKGPAADAADQQQPADNKGIADMQQPKDADESENTAEEQSVQAALAEAEEQSVQAVLAEAEEQSVQAALAEVVQIAMGMWTEKDGEGLDKVLGLSEKIKKSDGYIFKSSPSIRALVKCRKTLVQKVEVRREKLDHQTSKRSALEEEACESALTLKNTYEMATLVSAEMAESNKKLKKKIEWEDSDIEKTITGIVRYKSWLWKYSALKPENKPGKHALASPVKSRWLEIIANSSTTEEGKVEGVEKEQTDEQKKNKEVIDKRDRESRDEDDKEAAKEAAITRQVDMKINENVAAKIAKETDQWWKDEFRVLKLWDQSSKSNKPVAKFGGKSGHTLAVTTVMTMAKKDSEFMVLSGSKDTTMKIWSFTRERLKDTLPFLSSAYTLPGHVGSVLCAAELFIGESARALVSGSADKSVKLWAPLATVEVWSSSQLHVAPKASPAQLCCA